VFISPRAPEIFSGVLGGVTVREAGFGVCGMGAWVDAQTEPKNDDVTRFDGIKREYGLHEASSGGNFQI
jgi:hypothetical protein